MQEDAVQAARSHGLRQRGGLPPAGAHRHVRQLRQADLPRGVRALNTTSKMENNRRRCELKRYH